LAPHLSFCAFRGASGCRLCCNFCDTVNVWRRGDWLDFDVIDAIFRDKKYYWYIKKGAHLIVTGGDPLIQQTALVALFIRMNEFEQNVERMFVELETEGVIKPSEELLKFVRQWNVSPKLSNSGMSKEKRLNLDVLKWHTTQNSYFKFPVANSQDLNEVDEVVRLTGIRRSRVFLMPICATKEDHERITPEVIRLAKMSGYAFTPRMQLLIWNKTTGV
jgi:7-carboxy-7-deazaguanine synthase